MANTSVDSYTQTFTSFSGADITATFGNRVIGELQAINYTVNREKAPIYTMGSPDPRSFSRGKRAIAGSLVFVVFDRDALLSEMLNNYANAPTVQNIQTFAANAGTYADNILAGALANSNNYGGVTGFAGIATWDAVMTSNGYAMNNGASAMVTSVQPTMVDQLLPFNISIMFANEYGQSAQIDLYDVEILNNGMALSIDDIVTEQAMSFIACQISPMHNLGAPGALTTTATS